MEKRALQTLKVLFLIGTLPNLLAEGAASQFCEAYCPIDRYFTNFEKLAKSENWTEIMSQGRHALAAARHLSKVHEEAKICAQLTSTSFYQGNYAKALEYANRCHELSASFDDPYLFIRALYLESAVYRALAGKQTSEAKAQESFSLAVVIAEEAASIYLARKVDDDNLLGKIYFNLGAAHADNPKGDLNKAAASYRIALQCYQNGKATEDLLRTSIRLGKVYLLQKNYAASQEMIDAVRPQITSQRVAMQADYLEAQLKAAIGDFESAKTIALDGLSKAEELGANEDKLRLMQLLQMIEDKK